MCSGPQCSEQLGRFEHGELSHTGVILYSRTSPDVDQMDGHSGRNESEDFMELSQNPGFQIDGVSDLAFKRVSNHLVVQFFSRCMPCMLFLPFYCTKLVCLQGEAEVGIVEFIQVKNFMCHPLLHFSFNSNVNFIVGQNGSEYRWKVFSVTSLWVLYIPNDATRVKCTFCGLVETFHFDADLAVLFQVGRVRCSRHWLLVLEAAQGPQNEEIPSSR